MAGRVPAGADRSAVAMEMEDTFVQNLKHAAGVLSKVTPHLQHHNPSLGPKWISFSCKVDYIFKFASRLNGSIKVSPITKILSSLTHPHVTPNLQKKKF